MGASARSFSVLTPSEEKVFRAVRTACQEVRPTAGLLLFFGSTPSGLMDLVASRLAEHAPGVPALLVSAVGVLTEMGELEGHPAVAGLAWSGTQATVHSLASGSAEKVARSLLAALPESRRRDETALLFADAQRFDPDVLDVLNQERVPLRVVGAGAYRSPATITVDVRGRVTPGPAAALILRGLPAPQVAVSPACRLLMPLRPITETRGSLVLEIAEEGALDLLNRLGKELKGQPLILTVLAPLGSDLKGEASELLIRAIQGVDPVRGGVLVSPEVRPDVRMAFAVRDAEAAREHLQLKTHSLMRGTAGALPRFGLYFNCLGRGTSLYSTADVDTRIIKSRFAALPLLGMTSAFEIGPYRGEAAMHTYSGVLTIFTAPS